jgi:hypothetical protein
MTNKDMKTASKSLARVMLLLIMLVADAIPALARPRLKGTAAPSVDLAERYARLYCAVVKIQSDEGTGTGFFTSEEGQLVSTPDRKYISTPK